MGATAKVQSFELDVAAAGGVPNRRTLGRLSAPGTASMMIGRKALAKPRAVPRYRAEFGALRPAARVSNLAAVVLGIAIGSISCAAIAGSLTLETGQPQRIAATAPTPRSVIETRFFIVTAPAAADAMKHSLQTADACDDLAFRFLNPEKCTDSRGRHMAVAQPSRAATVVVAHSGAPSPDLNQNYACEVALRDSREHCRLD
jgi:hypothetical protein